MHTEEFAPGESMKGEAGSVLFRRHWGWLLAFAIVQIVAGSLAISVPTVASLAAVAVFGALMLTAAIFQVAHAVRVRKWPGFALHMLGGLLYAAAGVLVLIYPFPECSRSRCSLRDCCSPKEFCASCSLARSEDNRGGAGF